ncbi:MAG: DJ-1/PfpI family protein [Anaerolineaceae bacterium]
MSKILMIIPSERFRDEELFHTREELKKTGYTIQIASTRIGSCPGSRGGQAEASLILDQVIADEFEAVVFVGGGGSKLLYNNLAAQSIARDMCQQGKVVAAICLAPVILANAGLLNNKKVTVAGTEAKTVEALGATYMGPGVFVDGNIVTANAPKASRLFGKAIVETIVNLRERPLT